VEKGPQCRQGAILTYLVRRRRQRPSRVSAVAEPTLDAVAHTRHAALELDPAGEADLPLKGLGLSQLAGLEELDNLNARPRSDVGQARDGAKAGRGQKTVEDGVGQAAINTKFLGLEQRRQAGLQRDEQGSKEERLSSAYYSVRLQCRKDRPLCRRCRTRA
jgi:hypothetical protein